MLGPNNLHQTLLKYSICCWHSYCIIHIMDRGRSGWRLTTAGGQHDYDGDFSCNTGQHQFGHCAFNLQGHAHVLFVGCPKLLPLAGTQNSHAIKGLLSCHAPGERL
jgi:hypothetical protein